MKKLTIILFLGLFLQNSCAQPTIVNIVLPEDEQLNCEELKTAIQESQQYKKKAQYVKGDTGGNLARTLLFWPALAKTFHNADLAIRAADDRIYHLIKIMKNKKCKETDKLYNQIMNLTNTSISISQELKTLNEMFKSGILTKKEYEKAKDKVLNQ